MPQTLAGTEEQEGKEDRRHFLHLYRTVWNDVDDDYSRIGAAADPLSHGSQLSTGVGTNTGGGLQATAASRAIGRANNHNTEADKVSSKLKNAYARADKICESLNIPKDVADFGKLLRLPTPRVREIHSVNRTLEEFERVTQLPLKKGMVKTLGMIKALCDPENQKKTGSGAMEMSASGMMKASEGYEPTSRSCSVLAERICNTLGMSQRAGDYVKRVSEKIHEMGLLVGRNPSTIAGAIVYFVSQYNDDNRTLEQVSEVADMRKLAINRSYTEIYKFRDRMVEDGWQGDLSNIHLL
ncbi:hypothetical protein EJ04DRAFT_567142 [Polyplosphaeria fusca]|uniref:Transcription factor TFIIB cyclin-like domain-containing protein n=1 Tax=Polyplosphaeria fusca TaxID=682080 RepID=A0A9P4UWK2_9PLEO|nr:hypothetical protein EJ04DRAFT_567142 [Polyplosphaeria fusca]